MVKQLLPALGKGLRILAYMGVAALISARSSLPVHQSMAKTPDVKQSITQSHPERGIFGYAFDLLKEITNDRVLAVAAGVAFYGLLALFPAITTLVSFYAMFKDRAAAADDLATLTSVLPASAVSIVSDQINRIISTGPVSLSVAAGFSLLLALWSSNSGMKAAMDALNVAYGVRETRSFLKLNAQSLFFTLSAIVVLLLILAIVAVVPVVLNAIGLGPWLEWLLWAGRWPLLLLAANLAVAVLYRWGPCVPNASWRWYSPGTLFASFGFAALSIAFSIYAANFANFNETYGSLGAVIAFLTWSWLGTVIMLTGAELNAELDRRRVEAIKQAR
jgi:membrane protein